MADIKGKDKNIQRKRRQRRVRAKISGTAARPRLNIYRSLNNIFVQVIDDDKGYTLASASTIDTEVAPQIEGKSKIDAARIVGQVIGQRAKNAGISTVVFDRGGFRYHGRVAALADGARESGLEF
ncbi:MAG: 50S ribosomal protein L18 [Anaerolineae bacterium]|nr:50S ribosomal protein L18 [Anaerolineae bacterium]MDQ7036433.1 50S ribosomal protein L18 [Anaerolineae bacterium]